MTRKGGRGPRGSTPFKPAEFFARNPVFRLDEFQKAHAAAGRSPATTISILRYHVDRGHLMSLRRGLYGSAKHPIDPWVLGSKLTPDATIAHDGALSFYGLTLLGHDITLTSNERFSPFVFNGVRYRCVRAPEEISNDPSIVLTERGGQQLRVTSRERTLVDSLDRLDLGPGALELWDCFVASKGLDPAAMIAHALRLDHRVTCARLGYFLERLGYANPKPMRRLEQASPKSPCYFDRNHRKGEHRFLNRWNLVIPFTLLPPQ